MSGLDLLTVKLLVLAAGAAAIVWVSRGPLRQPGSHGFYRTFAWLAILGLFVLNDERWFDDPFAPWQLVSWFLLIGATFLVLHGVHLLRVIGRPAASAASAAEYRFENTTRLVEVGAYRYIRHPLYASLLWLAWGIYFKVPLSPAGLALALAASAFLVLTARSEEGELQRKFGADYAAYRQRTKMFVPFVF